MATVDKNFRVKNGLVVEGTTGTINGEDIITEDKLVGGTQTNISVTYEGGVVNFVAENGVADSTTDDLTEGSTNKYFSDELAQDAVGNAVGTGLAYDDGSGAISVDRTTTDTWYDASGAASTAEGNANDNTDALIGDVTVDGTFGNTVADRIVTAQTAAEEYADGLAGDYEASGAVATHAALTSTHGVSGAIVGTTDAQTISNKTLGGDLDADDNQITNLATPTLTHHAATKGYVDTAVSGLTWKESVNLLADSNVDISGDLIGTVIDGHAALDIGDVGYRILLIGQSTDSENGIYELTDVSGELIASRPADSDTYQELVDAAVLVQEGTTYGTSTWVQSNHYITDFTAQDWVQFGGTDLYTAGNGLQITGNEFSIDTDITATKTFASGEVATHAALKTTHGVTGEIVGTTDAQTLTGKTISGADNTLSNIANASLTNSAITVNGTSVSLGGSVSLDADDIDDSATTNKFFTDELAVDAVAAAIDNGTHQNITITYDDEANSINFSASGASIIDTDVSFTSVEINSVSKQVATTQTVATATQVVGHSFAHAEYTSAEYIVKITDGTDTEISKVLLTLDSSNNIAITEYGNVQSNGSLATITAGINGTDVELLVTTVNNSSDVVVSGTLVI